MKMEKLIIVFCCLILTGSRLLAQIDTLYTWGDNWGGQLGDGTTTSRTSPTLIASPPKCKDISAGYAHTMYIDSSGKLYAWGENSQGALGDGTTTSRTSPTRIGSATDWIAVSCGYSFTAAVNASGELYAWGYNGYGQLGDGTTTDRSSPTRIGTDTNWTFIELGIFHATAINSSGELYAWGDNGYGQLGDGTTTSRTSPTRIGSATNWKAIAPVYEHTLAINTSGELYAWGYNDFGQLGDGTTTNRSSPTQIGSATNWTQICGGGCHSIAINSSGELYTWGSNWSGELGDGTTTQRTSPTRIGSATNWTRIGSGFGHTTAINTIGELYAWGDNWSGQLGDGTTTQRTSPTRIGSATNWTLIGSRNGDFSFAIRENTTVQTFEWTGTGNITSTSNWSSGSVPGSTDSAIILSGTLTINQTTTLDVLNVTGGSVKLSAALTVRNLYLSAGKTLDLNGYSLTVGKFIGSGHITGSSASNITYTGSKSSFIYMDSATDGTTNRLNSLILNASAKMNLGNTLYILGNTSNTSGDLVLGSSSTLTSNILGSDAAKLKLKLSSSNTPAIIALNGGSIAGEIYYEDYLNAGYRGYRQWGHCLDSTSGMSLNQITDNVDLYADVTSGAGGRGSSGNINGLLASTSSAKNAVFTYDESLYGTSSRWVPYKVNGSTVLYAPNGKGLHFVLRPTGTTESGSYDAQVIDYEGQPNTTADVTVSVTRSTTLGSNDGWNLLSNPYPSYLNWASFVSDNSASLKNTTSQALYKYDKATKNYKATTLSGAKWYSSSSVDLGTNPSIDPGDAFFTQIASGASTLTFKRSQTTATRQSSIDRTNKLEIDTTTYSILYIKMRSASDSSIGDEATVISGSWGGDMKYGAGDALNLGGTCMDLSIIALDDQKLAFKTVSNKSSWLIPLYMTSCTQGDYTFDFSINANKSGTEGQYELVDNFKKTKKALKDGDRVLYQITGDSNSYGSGRFYLNSIMNTAGVDGIATTEQSWLVYPNPTTADGEISIANPKGLSTRVTIVNALGGVVHAQEIKANELGVKINLSPLHLSTGIYYIQMLNSNQQTTERLIIRNN